MYYILLYILYIVIYILYIIIYIIYYIYYILLYILYTCILTHTYNTYSLIHTPAHITNTNSHIHCEYKFTHTLRMHTYRVQDACRYYLIILG